jgi:hypothetical protein
MRNHPRPVLPPAGSQDWWQEVRGRCRAEGAGVTGKVILDGVAFSLPNHTPLPTQPINPGEAMAGWMQNDNNSFTGYPDGIY